MKRTKKLLICILTFIMLVSSLTAFGCGGGGGELADPNRTQLYVGVYSGGFGHEWLTEGKRRYEALHPDVQIMIEVKKDEFKDDKLPSQIQAYSNDLYFTSALYYYFRDGDTWLLEDITDVVTQDNKYGSSLQSRMWADQERFYNYGKDEAGNGKDKFYAVPFGGTLNGLNYDVDLFEEKGYFYDDNGNFTTGLVENGATEKSAGRDGIKGTYDDGTPVTFADFENLLYKMAMDKVTPFIWSNLLSYVFNTLTSMWADYEGKENFEKAMALEGDTLTLYDFSKDNFEEAMASTDATAAMTYENGYLINNMKGKAAALKLAELIIGNQDFYDERSGFSNCDFMTAQRYLLESKKMSEIDATAKRIAFILDGGYWHNESKGYNDLHTQQYLPEYCGEDADGNFVNERRFSVMPFPVVDGGQTEKATYTSASNFCGFIRKNAKQPEIAKDFLQFMLSDEMLKVTPGVSGYNMYYTTTLSADEVAELPYFYQVTNEIFQSSIGPNATTAIAFTNVDNQLYRENPNTLTRQPFFWYGSAIRGSEIREPFNPFKLNNVTIHEYMVAGTTYMTQTQWKSQNAATLGN